ncbi:MAG: HAMP domain-containing histidine kinase [Lachnospiraceae bacterium]|nr:HAMP domain-containing histidine kinase [Lachnospiraceae bacterium]
MRNFEIGIIVVLVIAFLTITIKYILYRRQIKSICRQIQFVSGDITNHRVRTDLTEKELVELAQLLNEMSDKHNKESVELINKDRRLKETLTSVSHDIRTPLTSLKGYFELLMSEEDTDKKLQYAGVMSERMDNLSDLLDELFTYTKLKNQDYKLELEECDMTKLVLDTIFSFYESFKQAKIEPKLDIDEKKHMVMANDVAMKRVISNIVKNAVVHGVGQLEISYGVDGDKLSFICKNKVAHPEDIDVTQIFDRFYKADKARSEKSTGLGLAIAKEFTEKMGGSIKAKLEGDVFAVKLILDAKR